MELDDQDLQGSRNYQLCDLEFITQPLRAPVPICKMEIILFGRVDMRNAVGWEGAQHIIKPQTILVSSFPYSSGWKFLTLKFIFPKLLHFRQENKISWKHHHHNLTSQHKSRQYLKGTRPDHKLKGIVGQLQVAK